MFTMAIEAAKLSSQKAVMIYLLLVGDALPAEARGAGQGVGVGEMVVFTAAAQGGNARHLASSRAWPGPLEEM